MDTPHRKPLEHRIMRSIALGGMCFGGAFVILSVQRRGFSSLTSFDPREFVEWLNLAFTLSFSLLLACSVGLWSGKEWGRRGFMIAAAAIAVCIALSRAQQLSWYVTRFATTQPSQGMSRIGYVWFTISQLIEELAVPAVAIWILGQPEFVRATQFHTGGGFSVIPVADEAMRHQGHPAQARNPESQSNDSSSLR
jgi:hypothetical protein